MDYLSLCSTVYAQSEKIDTGFWESKGISFPSNTIILVIVSIAAGFVLLGYVYKWYQGKKLSVSGWQYSRRKAMAQQDTHTDISEGASKLIIALANTANIIPEKLIADNELFEKAVSKVIKIAPKDPILNQVPGLREDLGFVFLNRGVPFISSKMLQPGQKFRVGVNFKGKNHAYVSTLLDSTESDFWIKPPTVKGKPVNLSKFKKLEFRVFRKSEGEFRFVCNLRSQINSPTNAIVMDHTNTIKRLPKRKDARY